MYLIRRVLILIILNIIGFNLVWFGLVTWRDMFIPVASIYLVLHFFFLARMNKQEVMLIFAVCLIGIIVDSALLYLGFYIFDQSYHLPLWLMVLWLCFATTLCHSLNFLSQSKVYQGLIGAFIAPLSYIAGNHLGAVDFGFSMSSTYALLALMWMLMMISFFELKARLQKTGEVNDRH